MTSEKLNIYSIIEGMIEYITKCKEHLEQPDRSTTNKHWDMDQIVHKRGR